MNLGNYEVWIPRWGSSSRGNRFWRCAEDVYGRRQVNYEHRAGNWVFLLCNNTNFVWRRWCNDCCALKDNLAGRRYGDWANENKQGNVLDKLGKGPDNVGQEDRKLEGKPVISWVILSPATDGKNERRSRI